MSRVYGEPIEVFVNDEGRPVRFVWRGRLYTVRRVIEHWVTTREWWRQENADPETSTEREFWRVAAGPGLGAVYELRRDAATGRWLLARMWD